MDTTPHFSQPFTRLFTQHMLFLLLFLTVLVSFYPQGKKAYAAAPLRFEVFEPRVLDTPNGLFLGLSCSVDDEERLRALLKDGAVLDLSIEVTIEGQRSWWFNKNIEEQRFVSTIRHNPLTREFSVSLLGNATNHTLKDKNLTRLLHASWRKFSFLILPRSAMDELDLDKEYTVSIGIDLRYAEAPPWFENSMGVWSSEIIAQQIKKIKLSFPMTSSLP